MYKPGFNAGGLGHQGLKVFAEARYNERFTTHGTNLSYVPITVAFVGEQSLGAGNLTSEFLLFVCWPEFEGEDHVSEVRSYDALQRRNRFVHS